MSIRPIADKKREKEKKVRPDAMHRAVRFLLEQAIANNRDIGPEAQHHLKTLDELLGDKKELEKAKPAAAAAPAEDAPAAQQTQTPADEPQDTAALLRQSSRFRR